MARSKNLSTTARRDMEVRRHIARQDMALGLMPIFRPLADGAQRKEIHFKQQWNGGMVFMRGVEMSEQDLAVLLALLALALRVENPEQQRGREIPGLKARGRAVQRAPVVTLHTSMTEICCVLGRDPDSHGTRCAIRDSIERLMMVVIRAKVGKAHGMTHLISGEVGVGRNAIEITLSYRLTRALLAGGSYAAISMRDYRALPAGVPRLVFAWLCAWMAADRRRSIAVSTLEKHIWPDPPGGEGDSAARARRRRAAELRAALNDLRGIGWGITLDQDTARIDRRGEVKSDVETMACERANNETGLACPANRPSVSGKPAQRVRDLGPFLCRNNDLAAADAAYDSLYK